MAMKVERVKLDLTYAEASEVFGILARHLNDPDSYAPGSGSTPAQGRAAVRASGKLARGMREARA